MLLLCGRAPCPGHWTGNMKQPCLKEARLWGVFSTCHTTKGKSKHEGQHFHPLLSSAQHRAGVFTQLKANISPTFRCINENSSFSTVCSWPGTALDGELRVPLKMGWGCMVSRLLMQASIQDLEMTSHRVLKLQPCFHPAYKTPTKAQVNCRVIGSKTQNNCKVGVPRRSWYSKQP